MNGKGEADVLMVCGVLGAYMLKLAGKGDNILENMKVIQSKIDSKEGLEKFKEMIGCQGGDITVIDNPEKLMTSKYKVPVNALESGYIKSIEAKNVGQVVVNLGGGRLKKEDSVDYAVGVEVLKKIGDYVNDGEPLMFIYSNDESKAMTQVEFLRNSCVISKEKVEKQKEILGIIE